MNSWSCLTGFLLVLLATLPCQGPLLVTLATLHCQSNGFQNLALRKPTSQSGTEEYWHGGVEHQGNSSFAVDGNTEQDSEKMTCSRTQQNKISWWMVDLEDAYPIQEVAILAAPERTVKNFTIETALHWDASSDQLVNPTICFAQDASIGVGAYQVFPCESLHVGRYVRITKYRNSPARLSLCEVQVYGSTFERFYSLKSRPGRRSRNQLIKTVISRSRLLCSAECRMFLECTSFNMADEGGVCELISDPVHDPHRNEDTVRGWSRYTMIP